LNLCFCSARFSSTLLYSLSLDRTKQLHPDSLPSPIAVIFFKLFSEPELHGVVVGRSSQDLSLLIEGVYNRQKFPYSCCRAGFEQMIPVTCQSYHDGVRVDDRFPISVLDTISQAHRSELVSIEKRTPVRRSQEQLA
jgi:hypothetical protein